MNEIRNILFVELLGGIGDILIALPAIHGLARSHPLAQMTVLTFAPGHELLETDPLIHRVICAAKGEARSSVDQLLAEEQFDLIVSDTTYDGIAEAIANSATPHTVTNLWRSPPADEWVGDRFVNILKTEGWIAVDTHSSLPQLHITTTERQTARQLLGASYRPLIFLCSDAGMSIKRWSVDRFITLGKALQQQYGATLMVPVGADLEAAQQIVDGIGGTAQLWPRGSLRSIAAAIAEADLMIAADTGMARIAAALNVPTITLFGPSWHGRYGQPAPHINLQGFPECPERLIHNFTEQRCWYSGACPFDWETCLDDISPDDVLNACRSVLHPEQRPHQNPEQSSQITALSLSTVNALNSPVSPISWQAIQKLLVIRLDNIGDVIMTSPVLRSLRENLPNAHMTLMASPAGSLTAPLLPWVDEVLPWRVLWQDLGRLAFDPDREWNLIDTLKQRQFDAAIILTSFSQSPHPAAFVCALAGIPVRVGESKEQDVGTLTHAVSPLPDSVHQVDRNLHVVESLGLSVRDRRLALYVSESERQQVKPQFLKDSSPYILLNPWTSCASRNYDPTRFAEAARELHQITGWPIVVTGVEKDRDRAPLLLTTIGNGAIDAVGATSLSELVALVAEAQLVLTNNTSTMHIADAMGTPNVVLFAGTELESQWRPRHSPSRLLRRPTVCNPCYAFTCPYQLECLDIAPEVVVQAALKLLSEGGQVSSHRIRDIGSDLRQSSPIGSPQ